MTYSIVEDKKECIVVHRIGIANQHLSHLDDVVDIIDSWLKSYGITPPCKEALKEYVRIRINGKRLELRKGSLDMFESKGAGWIIDYKEEQPTKLEVRSIDQCGFENYLFNNAKKNFKCPFRS